MFRNTNGKGIALFLLVVTVVGMTVLAPVVSAATIEVNPDGTADHNTIQDAVNAASDGDTINVTGGTYYETVEVTTSNLTIQSADSETVVITALRSGDDNLAVNDTTLSASNNVTFGENVVTYDKVTHVVDANGTGDYTTIQDAVNASSSDNATVITIKNGTYNESVNVTVDWVLFTTFSDNPDVTVDAENTTSGEAFVSEFDNVFVDDSIVTLGAVLGGGGAGGSSGFDLGILTNTFMGIPYWLIGLVALAIGYWYYTKEE